MISFYQCDKPKQSIYNQDDSDRQLNAVEKLMLQNINTEKLTTPIFYLKQCHQCIDLIREP